jgi:hypothetical protein
MTAAVNHSRFSVIARFAVIAAIMTATTAAFAQTAARPDGHSAQTTDCRACHDCDTPTEANPCLRACGRPQIAERADTPSPAKGPAIVILDELEDRYLPVPFDHRGHAEMAAMTRGCAVCHHYTPEGSTHPACKSCHEINPAREDLRKPGLKGAYHRQCLSCHREWSHETSCSICHPPKAGRSPRGGTSAPPPTPGDIVGRIHPPIPEPDTEIYSTKSDDAPGKHVIFRHKEHIDRFGLRCVECHHEDNCSRCHEAGRNHVQKVRTLEEHHQPCMICHNVSNESLCARCHWNEGEPKPAPFDHASTGWTLSRYHSSQSCRACHLEVPFAARDRNCATCHSDWTPKTFRHEITGLKLDETHAAFDCTDCHTDRAYDRPPDCTGCHSEDEGISYPARRPGTSVTFP